MTEFQLTAGAFDFRTLQAMAGGNCNFASIRLGEDYNLICDEEGQIKSLPVCMALRLPNGTNLPVFGPLAVVRARWTKKRGGSVDFVGLNEEDAEIVLSHFPWVTV